MLEGQEIWDLILKGFSKCIKINIGIQKGVGKSEGSFVMRNCAFYTACTIE